MNNKGQYKPQQPQSYSSVHPLLVIGIILFCVPFIVNMSSTINSIFNVGGIIVILIGSALSIYQASH